MNSRDAILQQLRRQFAASVELPEVSDQGWTQYEDPVSKFAEMVVFAGGACTPVGSINEVQSCLSEHLEYAASKRILSLIPEIPGNVVLNSVQQPHELSDLDYVICHGQLAVAENGAVWLTDEAIRHRVCFFITQFLAILVRTDSIVHNMHQAYKQVEQFKCGFGVFLAGPSKTADIEQSLVIGAHGCRALQVFILD